MDSGARLVRAAMLVVFAAAAILPFCTSFFLCSMPCCHRASAGSAVQMPMGACPGSNGCAPELSASHEEQAVTAKAPLAHTVKFLVAAIASDVPRPQATAGEADARPLPSPAPLHLLNSVFRI